MNTPPPVQCSHAERVEGYGWKKYCAGKNIALLKETFLKWSMSKKWPVCKVPFTFTKRKIFCEKDEKEKPSFSQSFQIEMAPKVLI